MYLLKSYSTEAMLGAGLKKRHIYKNPKLFLPYSPVTKRAASERLICPRFLHTYYSLSRYNFRTFTVIQGDATRSLWKH